MGHYRAVIEYDGTNYYGFQRQRRGVPTIQAELERALTELAGRPVSVIGAGRTDTGVHALGQVIGFELDWPEQHGLRALLRATNAHLPEDIAVLQIAETAPGFHPRFDARRRTYAYHIGLGDVRRPLLRKRCWQIGRALGVEPMNEASALLVGEHDFAAFGAAPYGDNTVREVYSAVWERREKTLVFHITANAFLNRMVRSLTGSLKLVGAGEWSVETFADVFRARNRMLSAMTAPAHGLYLVSVEYDD